MNYKTLFSQTKDLSLLIVEDYEPLRNDMLDVLGELFRTVSVASNGKKALKIYQEYYKKEDKSFDLVITDIQMPVMDGVELSEALRAINADQEIIVLSAHTDSSHLLRLINLGIAQFLTKPINNKSLIEILCQVSKKINTSEDDFKNVLLADLGENYIWDKKKNVLKHDNVTVDLTRHELLLLQFFVTRSELVCTNIDITQEFYAYNIDVSEKSIRNLVFKLRKKLPENTIESIYGVGYKLRLLD